MLGWVSLTIYRDGGPGDDERGCRYDDGGGGGGGRKKIYSNK